MSRNLQLLGSTQPRVCGALPGTRFHHHQKVAHHLSYRWMFTQEVRCFHGCVLRPALLSKAWNAWITGNLQSRWNPCGIGNSLGVESAVARNLRRNFDETTRYFIWLVIQEGYYQQDQQVASPSGFGLSDFLIPEIRWFLKDVTMACFLGASDATCSASKYCSAKWIRQGPALCSLRFHCFVI